MNGARAKPGVLEQDRLGPGPLLFSGKVVESPVEIKTPAGSLNCAGMSSIYLTGPAEFIGEGKFFLISETISST